MKLPTIVLPLLLVPGMAFASAELATPHARFDWASRFQEAREGPETTERFSRTVPIGANGAFELLNTCGGVVVTGSSGTDVRIDAVKRVRSRDAAAAKRLLDDMRIEVSALPSRVEVRTTYPNRMRFTGSIDFTIALPSGASASIRTISGDIKVTNVKGEVRVESISGGITTSGTPRLEQVKSVSGDVHVSDGASDNEVSAQTISGTLVLTRLKAREVELGTVSGDLQLDGVQCDRARIRSISGNVTFSGPLLKRGRYEFNSHSGDLRLTLTGNTGFEVDGSSFSGDLQSTLRLTQAAGREDGGRRREQALRGTYGDGSALLLLRTFSGDVVISRK